MGVVYRATDTVLGREVALKVLQERFGPGSLAARRFADEARITSQLQHPCIPAVHDLGVLQDGRPFLAMKLIKGDTLDAQLAARPGPSADRGRFVAVFEQVCQALAYAHAHGVIHRDLKPGNVMVGAFGEVQVMDWGLAKVLTGDPREPAAPSAADQTIGTEIRTMRESDGSFTQAGSVLGTPAFMPPEQAGGEIHKIDERSDVFGLGAILCTILTGKPAYVGPDTEAVRLMAIRGQLADALARLDDCGAEPELVALASRCLSAERDDRPANAGEVAKAVAGLRAAANERARQAELDRVRAKAQAAEQRRKRQWQVGAVAAAAVALLAAAVGLGAFLWVQARANTDLTNKNNELQAANDREAAARSDAEANLELANRAVDDFLVKVSQDERLKEQDLTELRRKLAASAKDFYARFVARGRDDPRLRLALGRAYYHLGLLHEQLGEAAAAVGSYRDAERVLRPLAEGESADPQAVSFLAMADTDLAALYAYTLKRYDEADHALAEAGPLVARLVREHPGAREYRQREMMLARTTGEVWVGRGHADRAESHLRRSVELQRRLLVDFPETVERRELARACALLGYALYSQSKLDEAHGVLDEGVRAGDEVVRVAPRDAANRRTLGSLHEHLGFVAYYRRDAAGRERSLGRSLELARGLVHDFPNIPSHQQWLSDALDYYADALTDMGRADEAAKCAEEGLALAEQLSRSFPDQPQYRFAMARRCNSLGRALHRAKRVDEGLATRRRAVEIMDRLWQEYPDAAKYGSQLGVCRSGLTFALLEAGRREQARDEGLKAVAVFEALVERFPGDTDHKFRLAETCVNVCGIAQELGRPDEIAAFARKGIAAAGPLAGGGNRRYQQRLASLYLYLGISQLMKDDPDEAAASFREGTRLDPTSTLLKANLDQALQLKAERDGRLAPPPREVRR
jgi:serine/threonine protein kinase